MESLLFGTQFCPSFIKILKLIKKLLILLLRIYWSQFCRFTHWPSAFFWELSACLSWNLMNRMNHTPLLPWTGHQRINKSFPPRSPRRPRHCHSWWSPHSPWSLLGNIGQHSKKKDLDKMVKIRLYWEKSPHTNHHSSEGGQWARYNLPSCQQNGDLMINSHGWPWRCTISVLLLVFLYAQRHGHG